MRPVYAVGLMSGTSIDGSVSAALLETDGEAHVTELCHVEHQYESATGIRPVHHLTKAAELACRLAAGNLTQAASSYPAVLKRYVAETFRDIQPDQLADKIAQLCTQFGKQPVTFAEIVARSTEVHRDAVSLLLQKAGVPASQVALLGYHGQTLFHDPRGAKCTIQVGDPQRLAQETGIDVVFDFRTEDVAHGGQGAPLAPVFHRALVNRDGIDCAAIINLGGTANITIVSRADDQMLGFDTGPANGLIDRYVKERAGLAMDTNSALATRGAVSAEALAALRDQAIRCADGRNFLEIPPPKSLDIRDYHYQLPEFLALSLEDGCATLNAFSAQCVADNLQFVAPGLRQQIARWILCGGGANSPHMRQQLTERIGAAVGRTITIERADDLGWSSAGMEASLFAYLAVRVSRGLPTTFPGTTGVRKPLCGGRVFRRLSNRSQ